MSKLALVKHSFIEFSTGTKSVKINLKILGIQKIIKTAISLLKLIILLYLEDNLHFVSI